MFKLIYPIFLEWFRSTYLSIFFFSYSNQIYVEQDRSQIELTSLYSSSMRRQFGSVFCQNGYLTNQLLLKLIIIIFFCNVCVYIYNQLPTKT